MKSFTRASVFGLLVLPLAASCGSGGGSGVALNYAGAFAWRGYADTDLRFDEFFFADHTITAWFMPQHPNAYAGPIVTTQSGIGFFLGQGSFRTGVPQGVGDWGARNLRVEVGNQSATYTTPSLDPGTWHHVALVREGSEFLLYLDGIELCMDMPPASSIFCHVFAPGQGPSANAKVRIGIRGDDQLYGLVDDIAFYDHALTAGQIEGLQLTPRLTGDEPGLVAGYTFDTKTPKGGDLPAVLARPLDFGSYAAPGLVPAFAVPVSPDRVDAVDAPFMPKPIHPVARRLPFETGKAWHVLWGTETPNSSHNDYAAFCWDFVLAPTVRDQNTLAEGTSWTTCGQTVLASAAATYDMHTDVVAGAVCDCDGDGTSNEPCHDAQNVISMFEDPLQRAVYMHLFTGSVNDALFAMPNSMNIALQAKVGEVGSRCANNCHLHVSVGDGSVTIPTSYVKYEVSTDEGAHWTWVAEGVPKTGEWVRSVP